MFSQVEEMNSLKLELNSAARIDVHLLGANTEGEATGEKKSDGKSPTVKIAKPTEEAPS